MNKVSVDERQAVTAKMAGMMGEQAADIARAAAIAVLGADKAIKCNFTVRVALGAQKHSVMVDSMVAMVLSEAAKHNKAHAVLAAIAAAL